MYLAKTELNGVPDCEEKKNAIESLDEIEKNIGYINKIVADLQDYARPLTPVTKEIELEQICQEILIKNVSQLTLKPPAKSTKTLKQVTADQELLKRV